ncbi:unnamed protein product [Schistosoma mattheei]|uniref:Uncharacterized protein n=1 Tax=Schistosoma mattheei TaxID=31246 RepID=A0A183NM75_9TREM|nr:unnamed protein product [Schistosoma mattheei]
MLWAGYFCVPDLSSIPNNFSTLGKSETIMNSNIFITAGPDATPDLDSIIPNVNCFYYLLLIILSVYSLFCVLISSFHLHIQSLKIQTG